VKGSVAPFEFTIRKHVTCFHLYSATRRRLYQPDYGGRHRSGIEEVERWLYPFIRRPSDGGERPVKLKIVLTQNTDLDLTTLCALHDAVRSLLSGRTYAQLRYESGSGFVEQPGPPIGPTATRELTRLLSKLDDFMGTPIVDRVASLA